MGSRGLLVQSLAVPKPDKSLHPTKSEADSVTSRGHLGPSAVVVSGGKQYRVVPGSRILVDRLAAEPGSAVKVGRVLLFSDADGLKVGRQADGIDIDAKVLDHRRGPRTESLRYKSKKRVRVHHGGRAHLTALEIIAVGGVEAPTREGEKEGTAEETKPRRKAKAAPRKTPVAKAEAKDAARAEVVEEKPEA